MAFTEVKKFTKLALTIALILIVHLLVYSYFLAMFLGPALFFFTPEGLNISMLYVREPPIWLFIVYFRLPLRLNVGIIFLFLWSVFAFCFAAAWQFRKSLQEVIGKSFSRPMKKLFDNCLLALPVIASMMLVAVIAIHSFQEAAGVPTGELPSRDPFQSFFEVSYAALAEETGFRVIPIGAFLIIYIFWVGRGNVATLSWGQRLKLFLTTPLFPDEAKRIVGLRTVGDFGVRGGISLGEWVMVFFTSIVFGLAHYLAGGGWEIGKITSASAVGLAMGLTYLLYGVQAPILLHWFFNYYNQAYYLASELYFPMLITFALIYLITIILGILGWLAVMIRVLYKMFRAIAKRVIRAIAKEVKSQLTPLP